MRSKTPETGTPVGCPSMSSFVFAFNLAKSTSAWNWLMSPAASACACADSRQ